MVKKLAVTGIMLATLLSCKMENPLLTESKLPYGAPAFDKIENEHYKPAFEAAIAEGKAEIDAIINNPEAPTFENTIEAMEYAGGKLGDVAGIFYALMSANTNDQMQAIAQELSPMLNDYSMYISLNDKLFQRVKAVYEQRETLSLDTDQKTLLENSYKSFVRNGANLNDQDKAVYSELVNKASVLSLQFGQNVLAATNAFTLNITDEAELDGLPDYVRAMGAETAKERGVEGWVYTLDAPSFGPFMKNSRNRELREKMWRAYNTRCIGDPYDNTNIVRDLVDTRIRIANILGYETFADYALEERMAKDKRVVLDFLNDLMEKSLPYAKKEVAQVYEYARKNGFEGKELMPWDFSYWSERYQEAEYSLNAEELKPYLSLESCINAAFDLAHRLYGINFEQINNVPVYHPDVKVYDITDSDGRHLALLYADFFPRASKRGGAWMTEFRGQSIKDGIEYRPFINMVTNFTKPTADAPSLITHDELTTLLHEFGHVLHGVLAEGRYGSLTGTNVPRDFVELPSQIMENWAYEPEFLNSFAKHYITGEPMPAELIEKVVAAKNYLAAYGQVRQLQFGISDMSWHTLTALPKEGTVEFEKNALKKYAVVPMIEGTCFSTAFSHIFQGGYSAGYYSYKWAEVLEADAFSLFQEKGIFNREVADSFRKNILSAGGAQEASVIYRNFRGHDPKPDALMKKLGLSK